MSSVNLEVNEITKYYGSLLAVDKVSFQASKGQVVGFLGPNAAGKSTTMKMITGFLTPSAGTAIIGGYNILTQPQQAKSIIGYLPEGAPAYPDMTVYKFLSFVAEVRGFSGRGIAKCIAEASDKVNLRSVLSQRIETLSKGFKRRVGLAQALLHDPQILILDEPTDGLDPNQKYEVRNLITKMAREKIIILSTHVLEEVEAICDRVVVIAGGKVMADSTPETLVARSPSHNVVRMRVRNISVATVEEALTCVNGVEKVEARADSPESIEVKVYPVERPPNFSELDKVVYQRGGEVVDCYKSRGHLDEVFRSITVVHQQIS